MIRQQLGKEQAKIRVAKGIVLAAISSFEKILISRWSSILDKWFVQIRAVDPIQGERLGRIVEKRFYKTIVEVFGIKSVSKILTSVVEVVDEELSNKLSKVDINDALGKRLEDQARKVLFSELKNLPKTIPR